MLTEQYFQIIRDYFGNDYEQAKKCNFRRESLIQIRKIYSDKVIRRSVLQTLYGELEKLNWKDCEEEIRNKGGVKAYYVGSEYGYSEPSADSVSK